MSWKYYFYIKQINILKTVFNFTLNQDLICLPHIGKTRGEQKNRLKFKKNRPVRFDFSFISLKLKKPNWTQTKKNWAKQKKTKSDWKKAKPGRKKTNPNQKTEPNRFCPQNNQTKPKPVGLNRFQFYFLKKISFDYFIFYKNKTESKWK
jgi:hypothetical protein